MKNKTQYVINLSRSIVKSNEIIDNLIIAQKSYTREARVLAAKWVTLKRANGGFIVKSL